MGQGPQQEGFWVSLLEMLVSVLEWIQRIRKSEHSLVEMLWLGLYSSS